MVKGGADVNKEFVGPKTSIPLYYECFKGNLEMMNIFLDNGADVNQIFTKNGSTPLFIVAQQGKLEIAKILIDQEANVNYKRIDCVIPICVAAQEGQIEMVRFFSQTRIKF